jgi:hypothetical protein
MESDYLAPGVYCQSGILGVTAPVDPILRPRKKGPTGRQELALVLGRRLIVN